MTKELLIISLILNVILLLILLWIWCFWTTKKDKNSSPKCKDCGISTEFSTGYCWGCEPDDDDDKY